MFRMVCIPREKAASLTTRSLFRTRPPCMLSRPHLLCCEIRGIGPLCRQDSWSCVGIDLDSMAKVGSALGFHFLLAVSIQSMPAPCWRIDPFQDIQLIAHPLDESVFLLWPASLWDVLGTSPAWLVRGSFPVEDRGSQPQSAITSKKSDRVILIRAQAIVGAVSLSR